MKITQLTSQDYQRMPWKNGGGVTTELMASHSRQDSSLADFNWRISIAEVGQSGPFSIFAGLDRIITLIEGPGMTLHIQEADDLSLKQYIPNWFKGDWTVSGDLVDGPVRDFNLIYKPDQFEARADCCPAKEIADKIWFKADLLFLHNLSEETVTLGSHILQPSDSLLFEEIKSNALDLTSHDGSDQGQMMLLQLRKL